MTVAATYAPSSLPALSASFYVTGGTLPPSSSSYVQRQADTDLIASLLAGEYCSILNSRQMGKSSLMARAIQQLQAQNIATAVIDLTGFGQNLTIHQWYRGLLIRLGQQLDLEDALEDFWDEHERLSPLQRWQLALQTLLLAHLNREVSCKQEPPSGRPSLVIFVDEIDIVRSLPFSADEFFAAIRQCYTGRATDPHLSHLCFCLLGVASPSELISSPLMSPFNIGRRIEVRDFTV